MKLLLTSSGLANKKIKQFFVSQFDRTDNKTAALITCVESEEEQIYVNNSKEELEGLGVKIEEINIAKDDLYKKYPEYDIYYVCGGNTYHILGRMRFTGMEKILMDAVNKNKFYLGVSAGSILAGPDIEIAGWGKDGDVNDIELRVLGSFNFTPFLIFPHFSEENKREVINFKKYRFQEPVIALTDNQALYVADTENRLVGASGGLQFCGSHRLKDYTS